MAFWDRFRRNKNQSMLPDEVNKYYQSEAPRGRGQALLLGLITLVVTLLIAAGLFFGGRAIYRHFAKDDNPNPTTTSDTNTDGQNGSEAPASGSQDNQPNSNSGSDNPSNAPTGIDAPAQSTPQTSSPNNSTSMPSTGDTPPTSLPRTGDEGM